MTTIGGVSNLEKQPPEVLLEDDPPQPTQAPIEHLLPRDVPLGGPRAMRVRRTLPQRARSLIGAWCFVDHYGPDDVTAGTGMVVPPHPHTGLQTVSWLFAGEIEHRDSTGAHATVRPGELNLMTAGAGIQHSEVSTPATTTLHGAQLWIALPEHARFSDARFEHYSPTPFRLGAATVSVFLGALAGRTDQRSTSPVPTSTPLLGAQLDLPGGARLDLDLDVGFEHGILLDSGSVMVDSEPLAPDTLAFLSTGRRRVTIEASSPARILLIGGAPFGERIIMWWNFVGRTHEEVVAFRDEWQRRVEHGIDDGRFGRIPDEAAPLPAPVMPTVRLTPRR